MRRRIAALLLVAAAGPLAAQADPATPWPMLPHRWDELPNGPAAAWDFAWTPVRGATRYEIRAVERPRALPPGSPPHEPAVLFRATVTETRYRHATDQAIPDGQLARWCWQVRAEVDGRWSPWSPTLDLLVRSQNAPPPPLPPPAPRWGDRWNDAAAGAALAAVLLLVSLAARLFRTGRSAPGTLVVTLASVLGLVFVWYSLGAVVEGMTLVEGLTSGSPDGHANHRQLAALAAAATAATALPVPVAVWLYRRRRAVLGTLAVAVTIEFAIACVFWGLMAVAWGAFESVFPDGLRNMSIESRPGK